MRPSTFSPSAYRLFIFFMLAGSLLVLTSCGTKQQGIELFGYTVKIGTEADVEQKLLGEMYRALIEDRTTLKAEVIPEMESPELIGAFLNNHIQIATFYNGRFTSRSVASQWLNPDHDMLVQAQAASQEAYEYRWLTPFDFGIRYALLVKTERANEQGWKNVSDLLRADRPLSLAVDGSWLEKHGAGYAALQEQYGIAFSPIFATRADKVYEALENNRADVILVNTHDVRAQSPHITALVDDRGFFPQYQPVPAVRAKTLREYPDLAPAIETLQLHLDLDTLVRLKHEVTDKGLRVKTVAESFLLEQNLLSKEPGT